MGAMMSSVPAALGVARTCTHRRCVPFSNDDRWKTRFARLVRRYGVARLARDLEVNPTAVYQWVRGSVSPRPDKAIIIIALVRPLGRLRLEDVYDQRRVRELGHAD
jgi:DNA-binding XRE family transcriptional regulator